MLSADTCWFSDGGRGSGLCQGHELMMHSRAVLKTHPPRSTLTLGLHFLANGWRVSLLSLQTMGGILGVLLPLASVPQTSLPLRP